MAFDLPRGPCTLRFTGNLRALSGEEAAPPALGQARPRPVRPTEPAAAPSRPSPSPPASRVTTPTRLTTMRGPVASVGDEDQITLCLDRDALDIALLPDARHGMNRPADVHAGPNLPVPHFRSKEDVRQQINQPTVIVRAPRGGALPLGMWLFAAMIAGIVSFHFAPQAREGVQEALRALDSH